MGFNADFALRFLSADGADGSRISLNLASVAASRLGLALAEPG